MIRSESLSIDYLVQTLPGNIPLELAKIPTGKFWMGSPDDEEGYMAAESPLHLVTLPSFYMGKFPVTQAQWRAVVALPQQTRPLEAKPSRFKGESLPVERISWDDAVEFCARLFAYTGLEYRLPSEAEWEYACRAGTTTPFHFGETITSDLANFDGTAGEFQPGFRGTTTPVGIFPANAFGLYDMHGNVWEWCADHWHNNYEDAPTNGSAWLSSKGELKVIRGGAWFDTPGHCRSAFRFGCYPSDRNGDLGFRVVCLPPNNL